MKFRKKPIVIDAVKFDGSIESITKMALEMNMPIEKYVFSLGKFGTIIVPTLEGNMITMVGDWVIKGVKGEYYPCKPDIFAMTYSEVEDIDSKVIDITNGELPPDLSGGNSPTAFTDRQILIQ